MLQGWDRALIEDDRMMEDGEEFLDGSFSTEASFHRVFIDRTVFFRACLRRGLRLDGFACAEC